jgi:hypothetical protein
VADRVFDGLMRAVSRRHIGDEPMRAATALANFLDDAFDLERSASDDRDDRTFSRESFGRGASDASAASGNECGLVLKSQIHGAQLILSFGAGGAPMQVEGVLP